MLSRLRRWTIPAVALLGTAGVAGAASAVGQPDPAGTRTFAVQGALTSYGFANGKVAVSWMRSKTCAGSDVWSFAAAKSAKADPACTRAAAQLGDAAATRLVARQGDTIARIRLAPAGVNRPDRLDILNRSTHRLVASWPLIDRPARVALHGNLAVLSAAKRHALYVLRITDGRIANVGITQPGDRPVIGSAGLLYQDALEVARDRDAQGRLLAPTERTVRLTLVPPAMLQRELARVGRPQVSNPIGSFAMDGPRVAYAVTDPSGTCDMVRFWNVQRRYTSVLTQASGPTCLPNHAPGGITDVAIGGSRAVWTTTYGSETRVLAASIIDCQEWVVARPGGGERVTGLAGDGGLLAYTVASPTAMQRGLSSVGVVPRTWGGTPIASSRDRPLALSADGGRVAVLGASGFVTISAPGKGPGARFHVGSARAIALQGDTVATLGSRGRLDVYAASTGRLLHSWRVAPGASAIDLQYGIALFTAGQRVYAMNTATGKLAPVFRAPATVAAQIESPGAAIQFNRGGRGNLRFVPMSRLEAITR